MLCPIAMPPPFLGVSGRISQRCSATKVAPPAFFRRPPGRGGTAGSFSGRKPPEDGRNKLVVGQLRCAVSTRKSAEEGLAGVVAVCKIDRLSCWLMDFSKLVEGFDRNGVTFVSVTQSPAPVRDHGHWP